MQVAATLRESMLAFTATHVLKMTQTSSWSLCASIVLQLLCNHFPFCCKKDSHDSSRVSATFGQYCTPVTTWRQGIKHTMVDVFCDRTDP